MTDIPHDPLLERLRAADPVARGGEPAVPARERVTAARRRRRARRARRLGGAGALTALAGMVALVLVDGGGAPLGRDGILLRAAQAAALPRHAIVVIDSEQRIESPGASSTERYMTWLRTSANGRIAGYRQLVTAASGERVPPVGLDSTGPGDGNGAPQLDRVYDPTTGRTRSFPALSSFPSTAFAVEVHQLLVAARANARAHIVKRDGYLLYESRALLRRGARFPGGLLSMREVRLDPKTYAPFFERYSERWRDHGQARSWGSSERVISRRTLPDTPANRRLLTLRGPTG
jgi:hypothetical protein